MKNESFEFKPGRRTNIPKPDGGMRPLTIAPPRDKIVQEAMRIILNEIFEPTFLETSHGFRPGKSCHTALRFIKMKFKSVAWVVEGDISKCFDKIDHGLLMGILERKITDRAFTNLIRKSLKAGYMEFKTINHNIVDTPQGSIISPILSNIFLHLLDEYVAGLKSEFDKGRRAKNLATCEQNRYLIKKAKRLQDFLTLKKVYKDSQKKPVMDFQDPTYKRLFYVRYADDWVIGIRGSYEEAKNILNTVREFCWNELKLEVSENKSKITNLNKEKVLFLGTNIFRSRHVKYSRKSSSSKQRQNLQLLLHVGLERVARKLASVKIVKDGKGHPRFLWVPLTHEQIIDRFNAVLRGYLNYYSFVDNYSRFVGWIRWIIYTSAARTLARKFNCSTTKLFAKYGPLLRKGDHALYSPSYKYRGKFSINSNPRIVGLYSRYRSIASLENLACSLCGSKYKVDMHHIRADLKPKSSSVDYLMARAKRKQIPLCRICHLKKHRGEI